MNNQYFQLVFQDGQAFLHIFPPREGGMPLSIKEVTTYLDLENFHNYDIKNLNQALSDLENESEVLLGASESLQIREIMNVTISLDKMKATCRFYPPASGGKVMTAQDIIDDLGFRKVKFGLNQEAIADFLGNRKYCMDYVFALGQQPVHGKDAKIEYFFNTNKSLQPKRNEDGSVDYKELNTVSHVKQGDLLARLFPEDPGKSGRNVYGEEIRPRNVKSARLDYGKNISINEDKTEIYSEVTGHANLINGKVFVSDVLEVPADVDNSIGNINYEGSVLIHGNVKSGFSVKAFGDIIVEGFVEGADIESDAQIIIKHGVNGMYKGHLKAKTNIIAKYIENATIVAGGYVEAEVLLNCDVSSNDCVRVKGKKGLINGGIVRAKNSIEADHIGTEMGTTTRIEVGVDPQRKERYIELNKLIATYEQDLEDLRIILNNYGNILRKGERLPQDKMKFVQQTAVTYKKKEAELAPMKEEIRQIYSEMLGANHASVSVLRSAYPGVMISISDLSYSLKDVKNYCKFKKQDGMIVAVNL